jgi:hypothetical protein
MELDSEHKIYFAKLSEFTQNLIKSHNEKKIHFVKLMISLKI